jgi:hypothetical protein
MIRGVLSGCISGVIRGVIGGGGNLGCPLYFFEPANSDQLDIPSTTGAITIVYATFNGLTGLAADFVTAPTNSPEGARADFDLLVWNTETVTATALTQIAGPTFDGVFSFVTLDGVDYIINAGAPFELYDDLSLFNTLELYA